MSRACATAATAELLSLLDMGEAMTAVAVQEPIAQTERGTPVYMLNDSMPEGLIPKGSRRGIGTPPPVGAFSSWLTERFPTPSCVIIRWRNYVRIFKLSERGDVFPVTARSIKLEDRKRLVESGLLPRT